MIDYENLKIVVNNTDTTTFEPENRSVGIEEFSYDPNSDTFIAPDNYEPQYKPPSPNQPSPPSHPL
jgi:hypothetical protein